MNHAFIENSLFVNDPVIAASGLPFLKLHEVQTLRSFHAPFIFLSIEFFDIFINGILYDYETGPEPICWTKGFKKVTSLLNFLVAVFAKVLSFKFYHFIILGNCVIAVRVFVSFQVIFCGKDGKTYGRIFVGNMFRWRKSHDYILTSILKGSQHSWD